MPEQTAIQMLEAWLIASPSNTAELGSTTSGRFYCYLGALTDADSVRVAREGLEAAIVGAITTAAELAEE